MTKRSAEPIVALCECQSEDCVPEPPLKKRLKLLQADYEAKQSQANAGNSVPPLIKLLPEVACALAEISDDEDDDEASVATDKGYDDASSAASVSRQSRRIPTPLPTRLMPLRAPARFLPSAKKSVVTKHNYCTSGKPLACPPMLLRKPNALLKEIDSTLL
ncbi:expressed unknown protein [Seminavis robusta]|uniref:Uncharacterized protein n=1 Tax=Seminavis robusta TaxID=568900 RepID=A0A9N8HWI6_9STRA|nr:expressed unknown protein [Seminavis robusta]|eukprot:Sro2224_g319760.1 n/a (161) ;mRNA; r:12264-12746